MKRREFLSTSGLTGIGLALPAELAAKAAPPTNPTGDLALSWTEKIPWDRVVDISTVQGEGDTWDARFAEAQRALFAQGGGVVFLPAGEYRFADHIRLLSGIVLRGADPTGPATAKDKGYAPPSRIEFPKYEPSFTGSGAPIKNAFKGIYLDAPATAANCGLVNLSINRGHVRFEETEDHVCGGNRLVFGCRLTQCAVADSAIPNADLQQPAWQRFTSRHHAAIDVKGAENILIANNRLPKSGQDNFTMKDYLLKPKGKGPDRFDVVFDYDNRPGLYISEYCIGGAGGSGNDGTPETHPQGFRKGIVIRDNYLWQTGRTPIAFTGDGTLCSNNHIHIPEDIYRPTATGQQATSGASTNDNRAIQMRGWRWVVDGNHFEVHRNWAADRKYLINDGEGLMHEDHCNSDIRDSRLTNNKGNSYLSIYKCGLIDGLHIEGNDISTPGKIADIYVVANRNSGPHPIRNVTVANNKTRSNGILVEGEPAENVVVSNNEHVGGGGEIKNEAKAKISGNKGYG